MRWEDGRKSENIEDRRGRRMTPGLTGGGIFILLLALVAMYFGVDPSFILQIDNQLGGDQTASVDYAPTPEENQLAEFVAVVLADTEDTWQSQFQLMGRTYVEPKLVLFSGAVSSACGFAQAAMGPFYCPGDRKVYIDLNFYQDLKNKLGAPGDFAQAYVIAHEVGHHIQNLVGILDTVHGARQQLSETEYNRLLVRLELQADCLAGVWMANATATGYLQPLSREEILLALDAAVSVGDDRIQQQTQGYVVPDAWTHGSSKQRLAALQDGLNSGDVNTCDTPGW